eukprot:365948-Chlamydomonas_euryale.AAC.7
MTAGQRSSASPTARPRTHRGSGIHTSKLAIHSTVCKTRGKRSADTGGSGQASRFMDEYVTRAVFKLHGLRVPTHLLAAGFP